MASAVVGVEGDQAEPLGSLSVAQQLDPGKEDRVPIEEDDPGIDAPLHLEVVARPARASVQAGESGTGPGIAGADRRHYGSDDQVVAVPGIDRGSRLDQGRRFGPGDTSLAEHLDLLRSGH